MTRKAAAPTPVTIEQRLQTLEAKSMTLQNQLLFAQGVNGELEREIADLRRIVVAQPARQWLTCEEAARLCGRSVHTVRAWCDHPHCIGVRNGRQWQVNRDQLIALLIERFGEDRVPAGLREGN